MNAFGTGGFDIVAHPGQSGPRGGGPKACRPCAVAKAKCLPSDSDRSKCERCSRLKKDCILQERKARRKRSSAPRTTRVAQLEQKLDDIVNLLKSHDAPSEDQDSSKPSSNIAYSALSSTSTSTSTSAASVAESPSVPVSTGPLQGRCPGEEVKVSPIPGTVPPRTADCLQDSGPSHQTCPLDQDAWFVEFKTSMAKYFPFVVMDDRISADELRRTKPFLVEVVLVAALYKDSGQLTERGKGVVSHLSQRMLLEGEKSLDLLQGLLVYISWYLNFFYTNRQMTNLLQLAIALVADLGLNGPLVRPSFRTVHDVMRTALQVSKDAEPLRGTLEEKRSFLGCFYLSSIFSSHLKGLEPLPYTSYVEECCQVLGDVKEFAEDVYLVQLVRIQRIVNVIGQHIPATAADLKLRAPFGMHVASIQSELNALKQSWGDYVHNKDNHLRGLLLMHYHSAEMLLYEFTMYDSLSGWCANDPFLRVESLYTCLEAALAVMDAFFSIPTREYIHINMVPWLQAGHTMIVMRKLCFLDVPGWDLKHVRSRLDVPGVLDRIVKNTTEARQARTRRPAPDDESCNTKQWHVLLELSKKITQMKQGFCEAIQQEERQVSTQPAEMTEGELWPGGETLLDMDEDFWQGFWQEWQTV